MSDSGSPCYSRYSGSPSTPPPYVGAVYIRFFIKFQTVEIAAAGMSGEFVHFYFNAGSPLFGLSYDYDAGQWNVNIDSGSVVKQITFPIVSDTPYQIDFKLYNSGQGLPTYLDTIIDRFFYSDATAEVYHGDLKLNKVFVGTIGAADISDRRIFNFTIGTHPDGNSNVFNGKITTANIVPPFDSREGSIVTGDTGTMRIQTSSAVDAYAIAEFYPQVF